MTTDRVTPIVFYQSARPGRYARAALLALLGLILVSGFTRQNPPPPVDPLQVLAGLLLLAAAAYLVYSAAVTRLVVRANGLEYRGVRGTSLVAWGELVAIRQVNGLYGHHFAIEVANARPWITLSQFGDDWETNALGQSLKANAPQLFKTVESQDESV